MSPCREHQAPPQLLDEGLELVSHDGDAPTPRALAVAGTKELEGGFWPHFLPPVKSSKFEVEMNPEKGSVPRKADAAIVRYLVTEAGEALAKK